MFSDFLFPLLNRKGLRRIRKDNLISAAFRERLMLAVTAVNGCRYCSYFHAKQALKSGVSDEEICKLMAGDVENCPEEEAAALIYAQHWADTDGYPDPEALKKVENVYGAEKTAAIHLLLRMIRMGNLMGNTWDYFLYRISFGRCRR
jgi:AhpD family alkylhydroperoxidase